MSITRSMSCHIQPRGDVMYGVKHVSEEAEDSMGYSKMLSPFDSSFRVLDSTDYQSIATIDVKKTIYDLFTDPSDSHLAVIENQGTLESGSVESVCRLYEIGHVRHEDDTEDEDQDSDEGEEDDYDDDDDDDDDDADDDDGDDDDDDDLLMSGDDSDNASSGSMPIESSAFDDFLANL